jgi:DMSO/TMAO reductase YedYZ molybdopterin-dependent catalytic subunit
MLAPAAAFARQNPDGRLAGTVPLGNAAGLPTAPLEQLLGSGLDARLFTDLSTISTASPGSPRSPDRAQTLVTPSDRFYVRTACPSAVNDVTHWTIPIGGLVQSPSALTLAAVDRLASRVGPFVMECAGNADPANYGLISAAEWEGAPMGAVLDRVRPSASAHRVLVSGIDDPGPSRTSIPGASWVFARGDLDRALLVRRMNGVPLSRDHGSPVRLLVPGWYGCACIKWVNRIDLVADEAPATTQMQEFAARTHQDGQPALAGDYSPAVIDTAAMPVRLEKWVFGGRGGRIVYRVIGIIWGGAKPTSALSIRFRTAGPWVRVDDCPLPASTLTWSVWTHSWQPQSPGRYQIVLRVEDPSIRTRRLDLFFYVRDVEITEI